MPAYHPRLCYQLTDLTLKKHSEIPHRDQDGENWERGKQNNWDKRCLLDAYITEQSPEEKPDTFSLFKLLSLADPESPRVWVVTWFYPYAPCRPLKRNKESRICQISPQCGGEARRTWRLIRGLVFSGQVPCDALTIFNRSQSCPLWTQLRAHSYIHKHFGR